MTTTLEETQEKRTITILNVAKIHKGDFVKFRHESDDIVYGVIGEIDERDVFIIVGKDLDGDETYDIGDFKERFLEVLSPGAIVEKLNIVRQAVA